VIAHLSLTLQSGLRLWYTRTLTLHQADSKSIYDIVIFGKKPFTAGSIANASSACEVEVAPLLSGSETIVAAASRAYGLLMRPNSGNTDTHVMLAAVLGGDNACLVG